MKLVEVLDKYNANIIKIMLAYLGKDAKTYKQENVKYLATLLPHPNRVLKELQQLDRAELVALTRLAEKNGRMSAVRLQSLLKTETGLLRETTFSKSDTYNQDGQRHALPEANPDYKNTPSFPDLIARLTCKGLLFSEQPLDSNKTTIDLVHGRIIFLPDYTLEQLKNITLPKLTNPAEITPEHIISGSSTLFVRDLSRYGRYLQNKQTLNLTSQNVLYKDDLKALAAQMSFPVSLKSGVKETDNGRIYFLRRLLPKVGLAEQRYYEQPLTAVGNAPFWQLDIPDRIQLAFRAWHNQGAWNELPQLHHYKRGTYILSDAPKELVKARKTVLDQIKALGKGWMSIHELIEDIKDVHYGFLFPKRHTGNNSWYYNNYRETHPYVGGNNPYDITFDNIRNESDGWDKVEADFINHIIAGPLFWMGLVDLNYDSKAPAQDLRGNIHIDGYRLTDMGLWLLGMGNKPVASSESGNLVIQPNFEIMMMAPFADEALLILDQFADVHKETKHVITYELTRLSVYRGQKQGWQAPRIAQWLDQNSSLPLPQNVQRTLDEWDALHNRIVIHPHTTLIETADSDTTQQIKESIPNGRFPAPTIVIAPTTGKKIATQLRNAGWLPIITHSKQTTAPNSVQIEQNGRITFLHPTPSIYAKGIIYPLSSETGDGRILTETQIKAAISDGQTYEQISKNLHSIHVGPISKPLLIKLKAWSKYYGDAHQESLILIEFENPKVYQELLSDPDLTPYLTPFPANGRFLATIHPLHIETVHALLAERGVDIHEGLGK